MKIVIGIIIGLVAFPVLAYGLFLVSVFRSGGGGFR